MTTTVMLLAFATVKDIVTKNTKQQMECLLVIKNHQLGHTNISEKEGHIW